MSPNEHQDPVPPLRDDLTTDAWHDVVRQALVTLGGEASLAQLYVLVGRHPRAQAREFWMDKVRQKLQASREFVRTGPGTWALSAKFSPEEIARFEDERRKRYPPRAGFTKS